MNLPFSSAKRGAKEEEEEEEEEEEREGLAGRESERSVMGRHRILSGLRRWWKMLVILGTPLLLSPLPLSLHSTVRTHTHTPHTCSSHSVT